MNGFFSNVHGKFSGISYCAEDCHVSSSCVLKLTVSMFRFLFKNVEVVSSNHSLTLCIPVLRVSQVYLAVDDRLASLKTDTFSKTREEKMEDLFAQKEVMDHFCIYTV